jgi:hypothetical protein
VADLEVELDEERRGMDERRKSSVDGRGHLSVSSSLLTV